MGRSAYSITKTALLGLVKVVAKELLEKGIRVNGVAPGLIRTKLAGAIVDGATEDSEEERRRNASADFGCGPVGRPHDVSGVVAFLCSPDARFITGETLLMTGTVNSRL